MAQAKAAKELTCAAREVDTGVLDLGQIYLAHRQAVERWARRLLGPADADAADDIVHEVFLVAQRRLRDFRGEAHVTTWLYAITVRVVQTRRRKERWRRWWTGRTDAAPAAAPDPHQQMESRRAAALVYGLLERLSEKDRSLLILFEIEGLSGEEIAAVTGRSVASVFVQLHRARTRFLKAYEAWERTPAAKIARENDK